MPITISSPDLEARLRSQAAAMEISVEAYLDRVLRTREAEEKLEAMLLEGIHSGNPIEGTPEYWAEKRRRLEERLQHAR